MKRIVLVSLSLLAFAANSILCRMALSGDIIDAASFTALRLTSGAMMLFFVLIIYSKQRHQSTKQLLRSASWYGATSLFLYATAFSFAYISLNTATGALILFGSVQLTMMVASFMAGERPSIAVWCGYILAIAGLLLLLLPGANRPSLSGTLLMTVAGVAWGLYSWQGKHVSHPLVQTTGNFLLTIPMLLIMLLFSIEQISVTAYGATLAIVSGSLTSGLGYLLWYYVITKMSGTSSAAVQLSVPVLAAVGGMLLLQESITLHLLISSIVTLGGIALVILKHHK